MSMLDSLLAFFAFLMLMYGCINMFSLVIEMANEEVTKKTLLKTLIPIFIVFMVFTQSIPEDKKESATCTNTQHKELY